MAAHALCMSSSGTLPHLRAADSNFLWRVEGAVSCYSICAPCECEGQCHQILSRKAWSLWDLCQGYPGCIAKELSLCQHTAMGCKGRCILPRHYHILAMPPSAYTRQHAVGQHAEGDLAGMSQCMSSMMLSSRGVLVPAAFLLVGCTLPTSLHAFWDGPMLKVCTAAGSGCGSREGEGTQGARGGC